MWLRCQPLCRSTDVLPELTCRSSGARTPIFHFPFSILNFEFPISPFHFQFLPSVFIRAHPTINQIYDAGVGSIGNPLSGGSADPNYTLNSGDAVLVDNPVLLGGGAWGNNSHWLSVNNSGGTDGDGVYTYDFMTPFTLSGLANVSLCGQWVSDNASTIWLNNHQIGTIPFGTQGNWSFQYYTSFSDSVQSDFNLNGRNTLRIVDVNGSLTDPDGQPAGPFGVTTKGLTITGTPVSKPTTIVAGATMDISQTRSAWWSG